jgi:AraC-like DNA-binding protein
VRPAIRPPTDTSTEPPLAAAVFDTGDYPEPERERLFLHVCSDSALVEPLARPVRCRMELYELGDIRLRVLSASAHRRVRLAESIAFDRRNLIQIVLVRRGAIHGGADGRPVAALVGEALVLDLGRPLELEQAEGETVALELDRELFARGGVDGLHGAVLRGVASRILCQHLAELSGRIAELSPRAALAEAHKLAAVMAACLPGGSRAPVSPRVLADDLRVFERAARFIDANLGSAELQPGQIWRAAHVSRSRLYRVFASLGGVARYVARQRLAEAYAALTRPGEARTIASIAHDFGFANVSHFARCFRAEFGRTARQVRSSAPAAPADHLVVLPERRSWFDGVGRPAAGDGQSRH